MQDLSDQLKRIFPEARKGPNGEWLVNCPECPKRVGKTDNKHHLYVNPNKFNAKTQKTGSWYCHRCGFAGWGVEQFGIIVKELNKKADLQRLRMAQLEEKAHYAAVEYPEYFSTSFSDSNSGKACYNYLTKVRGIPHYKIMYYKLGYCYAGKFKDCVVLPVYHDDALVFYIARNIYMKRYINASLPNRAILFNLRNQKRIIITEGIFDAISVGLDGVALMGKFLKDEQKKLLMKAYPSLTYILLDKDAKKDAVKIAQTLCKVLPKVKLVSTGIHKDPGEMSELEIEEALKSAYPATMLGMMNYLNE